MSENHSFRRGPIYALAWRWGAMLYVRNHLVFWCYRDYRLKFSERNGYQRPPRRLGRWSFHLLGSPHKKAS